MPDGLTRVPAFQRNAGGRVFETGADLNRALVDLNATGGINGQPLPYVRDDVQFGDGFSSFDLRVSRPFTFAGRVRVEPMVEVFNLFNVTNILGIERQELLGLRQRARARQRRPGRPGIHAVVEFRRGGQHGGRRVWLRRPARVPVRRACHVLTWARAPRAAAAVAFGGGARRRAGDRRRHLPDARHHHPDDRLATGRAARLGRHGDDGDLRRALLRRAGGALPAGRRRLRLPARSLRAARGLPLRLEVPAGDGPGNHGRPGDRLRQLRRLHRPARQRGDARRGHRRHRRLRCRAHRGRQARRASADDDRRPQDRCSS